MASANLQQTVVKLDVGGVCYKTTLSTLTRYPESMFAIWFENWNAEAKEEYFIDFDGDLFKHVLEFLRFGESTVLPEEDQCLKRLLQAADYFQLPRLQSAVNQKRHEMKIASDERTAQFTNLQNRMEKLEVETASLHLKLRDIGRQGLSGETLAASALVKLSCHGVITCLDSFVAQSLDYLRLCSGDVVMLGLLNTSVDGLDNLHVSARCPSCLVSQQQINHHLNESKLRDKISKNRDGLGSQLSQAKFQVTRVCGGDCVEITSQEHFQYKRFHVAKSFLCAV